MNGLPHWPQRQRQMRERELFVGRFQQVTIPVMAKGVEDTAFYRHLPLSSLNEVGADRAKPPAAVECFHRENAPRLVAQLMRIGATGATVPAPVGAAVWGDTRLNLDALPLSKATNVLTGQHCTCGPSGLLLADALADFPVAVLQAH